MPRCNLTLRQKCQIIELHKDQSTDAIAKKFHVHPSTVLRTLKKKNKILDQASRVNFNFKTVQTNLSGEEHDIMVLEYIKARQEADEPISIKDICDKALECAKDLNRNIKSKRGWWRRFKFRCNIVRSRVQNKPPSAGPLIESSPKKDKNGKKAKTIVDKKNKKHESLKGKKQNYTFKIRAYPLNTTKATTATTITTSSTNMKSVASENEPSSEASVTNQA